MTDQTDDADDTFTEYSFDPDEVLDLVPDEYTARQELVLAAAVRNPDASLRQLGRFTRLGLDAAREVLLGYANDTIRNHRDHGPTQAHSYREYDPDGSLQHASEYEELTDKQQAMCDFFARYPVVANDRSLTSRDRATLVLTETGTAVSGSYPAMFLESYGDLVSGHRADLLDAGEALPEVDEYPQSYPEALEERDTRELLTAGGVRELPEENLDFDPDTPLDSITHPQWVLDHNEASDYIVAIDRYEKMYAEGPDEFVYHCPVAGCETTSTARRGIGNHISKSHADGTVERIKADWNQYTDKLWEASLYYTADMLGVEVDILDFIGEHHAAVVEYVNDHPQSTIQEVADAVGTTYDAVRNTRDIYEELVPDEWLDSLYRRKKDYARDVVTEETNDYLEFDTDEDGEGIEVTPVGPDDGFDDAMEWPDDDAAGVTAEVVEEEPDDGTDDDGEEVAHAEGGGTLFVGPPPSIYDADEELPSADELVTKGIDPDTRAKAEAFDTLAAEIELMHAQAEREHDYRSGDSVRLRRALLSTLVDRIEQLRGDGDD